MNGHDPRKRLDLILRGGVASRAEAALDALNVAALESSGLWEDDDSVPAFWDIIGIILVACQPLSSAGIDALLQLPEGTPSAHNFTSCMPLAAVSNCSSFTPLVYGLPRHKEPMRT